MRPERDDGLHQQLVVSQRVDATPEAVWELWTTEDGLSTWWWTGWVDTTFEVDLRVGGRYRIAAPSVGIVVSGEFLVLDRPHRLAMSWVWEDADGPGPVERVEVDLEGNADGTMVTVQHTGPWEAPDPSASYEQGWRHVLSALTQVTA